MATLTDDYRDAVLAAADRGMLDFCAKLTRTPAAVGATDVEGLRQLGFDDATIHDIVQVAALFNYYDRLAEGMGIDPEPEWSPRPPDW